MRLSPSHWSSEITSKSFFSGCSETLPLGLARPRRPDGLWLRDWLASPLEASTSPRLLNPFAPSCSPISEALHLIPKTAEFSGSPALRVELMDSQPPAKAWLRAARWLIV